MVSYCTSVAYCGADNLSSEHFCVSFCEYLLVSLCCTHSASLAWETSTLAKNLARLLRGLALATRRRRNTYGVTRAVEKERIESLAIQRSTT